MAYSLTPRPPTKKIRDAIGALLSGAAINQRQASLQAGIHEVTLSQSLKRQGTKDYILSVVRDRLSTIGVLAASRVAEALVETAESDYVRADIAKFILGVAGVKPERDVHSALSGPVHLTVIMGHDQVTLGQAEQPQVIDITPQSTDKVE